MEVIIEFARETGLRMQSSGGQTLSVVGAVVIGQAAVIAGLIRAPVVVSLGYSAFAVVPSLDTRLCASCAFPLVLLASLFGVFGLFWGLTLLLLFRAA